MKNTAPTWTLPYQAALLLRLLDGVRKLDPDELDKTRRFVLSARCDDGGFHGREAGRETQKADLYYTSFALRSLLLSDPNDESRVRKSLGAFLRQHRESVVTPAELFAYTFCFSLADDADHDVDRDLERERLLRDWATFRRADACYAASENTPHSSTYMTFLAANAFEMLGAEPEKSNIDIRRILDRQRPDGGFVELSPLRHSGTNPTAAAVSLLKMTGQEPRDKNGAVEFLLAAQTPEGGFQANTRISCADLLSSFTALVALTDLGAETRCNLDSLERFVKQRKTPEGAYHGAAWDRECDVEYTFYGLALEATLAGSPIFRKVIL